MRSRCAVLVLIGFALPAESAELPNIVVLLSDDLGRFDNSVYGSTQIKTPTMKALAARGMVFDNAYVASPSCCPNRASLFSALMPARHGAHPNHTEVMPGTPDLSDTLKAMGYQIVAF